MTKIIAFAGRKQSGKTTCSEFVKNILTHTDPNKVCTIYNFADPLKQDICINILGLTYDQCYGTDEQKNSLTDIKWKDIPGYNISWTQNTDYDSSGYMTARQIMQVVGTDIFRQMKNNVWAGATINKIRREKPRVAIIADCRFPNEVDTVHEAGGIVVKLTRNPYYSNHMSETALDDNVYDQAVFDLIINNHNISITEQHKILYDFLNEKGILSL